MCIWYTWHFVCWCIINEIDLLPFFPQHSTSNFFAAANTTSSNAPIAAFYTPCGRSDGVWVCVGVCQFFFSRFTIQIFICFFLLLFINKRFAVFIFFLFSLELTLFHSLTHSLSISFFGSRKNSFFACFFLSYQCEMKWNRKVKMTDWMNEEKKVYRHFFISYCNARLFFSPSGCVTEFWSSATHFILSHTLYFSELQFQTLINTRLSHRACAFAHALTICWVIHVCVFRLLPVSIAVFFMNFDSLSPSHFCSESCVCVFFGAIFKMARKYGFLFIFLFIVLFSSSPFTRYERVAQFFFSHNIHLFSAFESTRFRDYVCEYGSGLKRTELKKKERTAKTSKSIPYVKWF